MLKTRVLFFMLLASYIRYGDGASNTVAESRSIFFPNPNLLVAVSKGIREIKLRFNKILQFLTGVAGSHGLTSVMAVKQLYVYLVEGNWQEIVQSPIGDLPWLALSEGGTSASRDENGQMDV